MWWPMPEPLPRRCMNAACRLPLRISDSPRRIRFAVDVREWGGGLAVAQQLERANIMVNKMLLPSEMNELGGIRIGTVEVTRYGMDTTTMSTIADLMHRVVVRKESPELVAQDVQAPFRIPGPPFLLPVLPASLSGKIHSDDCTASKSRTKRRG